MLCSLRIENAAVIDRTEVVFSPGFNVLSGETGAGKSIVIDSLNAILGGKTGRDLVRTGAEAAVISAVFESSDGARWCRENDIDCDGDEIIVRRKINADGKSSVRINGEPVTVTQLRSLGNELLDIHGQNDGRLLLDERRHLAYLDGYGVSSELVSSFKESFTDYSSLVKDYKNILMDEEEKERLEDSLRRRIDDLEKAELRLGEEEELSQRRDLLRNSERLTESLNSAYELLYAGDNNAAAFSSEAAYLIDKAAAWDSQLADTASIVREAYSSLCAAADALKDSLSSLDYSPDEYDRLEERLSQLKRLKRRYNTTEEGLVELLDSDRARLDELEYLGDRLLKLEKEIREAQRITGKKATELSKARFYAAEKLEKQVEKELAELSMPSVRFLVTLAPKGGDPGFGPDGMDEVSFFMSANAGEKPGPINRIASGGELSRIMLALKTVFSAGDGDKTLVFDEIDTGVSGIAAQRVAEKLACLSNGRQVICVSHLPQIASMADAQYLVKKQELEGRTFTEVHLLDREGRARELARLYEGDNITDITLRAAEQQLKHADEYKKHIK